MLVIFQKKLFYHWSYSAHYTVYNGIFWLTFSFKYSHYHLIKQCSISLAVVWKTEILVESYFPLTIFAV